MGGRHHLQEVDQGQPAKTGINQQGRIACNFGSKPVVFMILDCRLQRSAVRGAELNGFDGGFSVRISATMFLIPYT